MCGIAGFSWNDKALLRKMAQSLNHRGPDGTGFYVDESMSLGHSRLAIIDLSKKAGQPMANEDETLWIVFNGEIYNYRELRVQLEKKHKFASNSDTEVILHAYEEFGPECVEKFNGMWAFCIYDTAKKRLFLSVDRLEKKPLYYYHDNGKFIFASELKAVLDHDIPRIVDESALRNYLFFGYVPAPKSIIKNVSKLEPSSYIIYDLKKKRVEKQVKYFDITKYFFKKTPVSEAEAIKKVGELLEQSVNYRMVADVPVGAFLSGGIDSSLIVYYMQKQGSIENLHTFSIGFERGVDETKYSDLVSEELGTNHHHMHVDSGRAIKIFEDLAYFYDEPFADSSMNPTFAVSELARKYVTVSLSGDAGDEVFGGYDRYLNFALYNNLRKMFVPKFIMSGIPFSTTTHKSLYAVNRALSYVGSRSDSELYSQIISYFNTDELKKLGLANPRDVLKNHEKYFIFRDPRDSMLCADLHNILPGMYFTKVDRASMANSLEVRCPFADVDLVKFSSSLSPGLKFKDNISKYVLKKLLSLDMKLPQEFFTRKKQGFGFPVGHMLDDDYLIGKYLESGDPSLYKYVSRSYAQKLVNSFHHNVHRSWQLYSLISLEMWMRKWL